MHIHELSNAGKQERVKHLGGVGCGLVSKVEWDTMPGLRIVIRVGENTHFSYCQTLMPMTRMVLLAALGHTPLTP